MPGERRVLTSEPSRLAEWTEPSWVDVLFPMFVQNIRDAEWETSIPSGRDCDETIVDVFLVPGLKWRTFPAVGMRLSSGLLHPRPTSNRYSPPSLSDGAACLELEYSPPLSLL